MQDERGIVERLRYGWSIWPMGAPAPVTASYPQAADLIEQQAREIERLREELARVASG